MDTCVLFKNFARYNAWMNARLYELSAGLPESERRLDRGAFFGSIHGTLSHILVGDRLWMGRFTASPYHPAGLDADIHPQFDELRRERERTDGEIVEWVDGLSAEDIGGTLTYTSLVNPEPRSCSLGFAAQHFFNHQTHHRGQVTTLLNQAGVDPGVTDLMWLPGGELVG